MLSKIISRKRYIKKNTTKEENLDFCWIRLQYVDQMVFTGGTLTTCLSLVSSSFPFVGFALHYHNSLVTDLGRLWGSWQCFDNPNLWVWTIHTTAHFLFSTRLAAQNTTHPALSPPQWKYLGFLFITELLLPATILPSEGISRIASYALRDNMLETWGVFLGHISI